MYGSCAPNQEISGVLWKQEVYYRIHRSLPLVPELNQVHIFPYSSRSILILSLRLRLYLPYGFFLSDFTTIILQAFWLCAVWFNKYIRTSWLDWSWLCKILRSFCCYQRVSVAVSPAVKRPGSETNCWPPFNTAGSEILELYLHKQRGW